MFLGAETPAIIGSVAAIIALLLYSKLFAPKKDNGNVKHYTAAETFRAWSVYFFILLFILLSGPLFPDINSFLKSHLVSRVALPIYADGTTFNFGWISNAGLMLLLGTVIGGLIQGVSPRRLLVILARTTVNLRKTVITIISLVSLASVMNYAGMIVVIASALAAVTGQLYPVFAPLIGAIGTFVTGSDTSSNILFAKLQANVAHQLNYGNSDWLVTANTTGATGGKMISPQSIASLRYAGTRRRDFEGCYSVCHCIHCDRRIDGASGCLIRTTTTQKSAQGETHYTRRADNTKKDRHQFFSNMTSYSRKYDVIFDRK